MTEGERWAQDELQLLRRRGFTPAAIHAFLLASQRRSAEVRRASPALARRARRWEVAGFLAWGILAAGGVQPFRRRLATGLGWWAATSQMLEWHLGMVESADGVPRNLGTADALTLTRAWLVPVIADSLSPAALAVAAVTDGLDGVAARATVPTRAGRHLEGLVDASVLTAALMCAARERRLHAAVIGLELGRLVAGVGFATAVYFARAHPPSASVLGAGRWTTPLRIGGLIAAGTGRRRAAGFLVATGSLASLGLLASATRGPCPENGPSCVPRAGVTAV